MAGVASQSVMQAATEGKGIAASSQLTVLAAFAPPSTRAVDSTLLLAQAAYVARGVPAVAQSVVLVAYRVKPVENLTARAWTFTLDGHDFYVITLGEQGTWVYDLSTGQWSNWETSGLGSWNMERGITWKGDVIAADREAAVLWRLDPTSFIDDDFTTQERRISGALSLRGNQKVPNFDFRLTASVGEFDVANTAPPTLPILKLSVSDDQGRTFQDRGTITITDKDFDQEISWRSLGEMKAPGRIFMIIDTGAVARIDGADANVGEDD